MLNSRGNTLGEEGAVEVRGGGFMVRTPRSASRPGAVGAIANAPATRMAERPSPMLNMQNSIRALSRPSTSGELTGRGRGGNRRIDTALNIGGSHMTMSPRRPHTTAGGARESKTVRDRARAKEREKLNNPTEGDMVLDTNPGEERSDNGGKVQERQDTQAGTWRPQSSSTSHVDVRALSSTSGRPGDTPDDSSAASTGAWKGRDLNRQLGGTARDRASSRAGERDSRANSSGKAQVITGSDGKVYAPPPGSRTHKLLMKSRGRT